MRIDNPTFAPGGLNTVVSAENLVGNEWINAGTITIGGITTAPTKGATVYDTVRYRKTKSAFTHQYNYGRKY
jgi:hypothetical protein